MLRFDCNWIGLSVQQEPAIYLLTYLVIRYAEAAQYTNTAYT